jgi:hypothetical protein
MIRRAMKGHGSKPKSFGVTALIFALVPDRGAAAGPRALDPDLDALLAGRSPGGPISSNFASRVTAACSREAMSELWLALTRW